MSSHCFLRSAGLPLQSDKEELQIASSSFSFENSLNPLILSHLKDGYPDIALIAKTLGMSTRSLQRRLAEKHISYSLLIEQVRFEQTIHLLKDSDQKITDIAFNLGYEEQANFTRAFKRWTGISPSHYRRLYLKTDTVASKMS